MSASLLQKSLRLFEETDSVNKGHKTKNKRLSKEQKILSIKKSKKETSFCGDKLTKNLKALRSLECDIAPEVSEKVFARNRKSENFIRLEKKEEESVFTEEDFEKFEKEYFVS